MASQIPRSRKAKPSDGGYASLAAVAGIAVFAYVGLEALAIDRGVIAEADARTEQARMAAAADAAIMQAVNALAAGDPAARWPIDGRVQKLSFDGLSIGVALEDERGKLSINDLNEDQVRALFANAGVAGQRLEALVDSVEDWIDDDDDRRPLGAEAPDYAAQGIRPRNGGFRTVEEMVLVHGMDASLLQQIRPAITVSFGASGGFSPSTAQPLAIAVLNGTGMGSVDVIERQRALAGEVPTFGVSSAPTSLTGREVTVRVTVADGAHARLARAAVVELTGDKATPYWIRGLE